MGKLKQIELNKSLSGGDFETDSLELDGNYGTAEVTFDSLAGTGCKVTLQTSTDGAIFYDYPGSETEMDAGDTGIALHFGPLAQDTRIMIKVVAGSATGTVKLFKLRCDERKG